MEPGGTLAHEKNIRPNPYPQSPLVLWPDKTRAQQLFRTLSPPARGMFGQIAPMLRQLFESPLFLSVGERFGRPFAMLGHFFVVLYFTVAH
jgi:hypothetical protein